MLKNLLKLFWEVFSLYPLLFVNIQNIRFCKYLKVSLNFLTTVKQFLEKINRTLKAYIYIDKLLKQQKLEVGNSELYLTNY